LGNEFTTRLGLMPGASVGSVVRQFSVITLASMRFHNEPATGVDR
jgi:hypothetical protein